MPVRKMLSLSVLNAVHRSGEDCGGRRFPSFRVSRDSHQPLKRQPPPPPDFTGVWHQVRHENADAYFTAMGYSFAMRKIMAPFFGQSTEVVSHDVAKQELHLKSINRRGVWTRTHVDNRPLPMRTADGQAVEGHAWWEKDEESGCMVYKTKLVGAKQGTLETWRWIDRSGDDDADDKENRPAEDPPPATEKRMVVKSIVYPDGREEEATHMFWHFESQQNSRSSPLLKSFEETYVAQTGGGARERLDGGHGDDGAIDDRRAAAPRSRDIGAMAAAAPVAFESLKDSLAEWVVKFSNSHWLSDTAISDRFGIFD